VHPLTPVHIAAGNLDGTGADDLVIDFGPGVGIWPLWNGTTWTFLHELSSEDLVLADVDGNGTDEVIIDFGAAYGVWEYVNGSTWQQLHWRSPKTITAGRFH
jgi:hypothetical protein